MMPTICRAWLLAMAATILLLALPNDSHAVPVDTPLADPALEARARALHKQIRCLVCQNQSIDDSNADLARDLRIVVRQRISRGGSNQEVLDYLVDRYGDWVLLNPPFKARTIALWLGPLALLLLGGTVAIVVLRQQRTTQDAKPEPLSTEEKVRLDALINNDRDTI